MARPRKPHGTQAAYKAHLREKTRICDACQAWKDGSRAENPLAAQKIIDSPEFKAAMEAADAKRSGKKRETTPENPRSRTSRRIDPLAETFDNLDTVQAALDLALSDDVARVPALSKRKSELIAEITALGGVIEAEEKTDKLGGLLDAPTAGGEGDLGDNVLGFRKATA